MLPRRLQIEFSKAIQTITEDTGTEIQPAEMWDVVRARVPAREPAMELLHARDRTSSDGPTVTAQLLVGR